MYERIFIAAISAAVLAGCSSPTSIFIAPQSNLAGVSDTLGSSESDVVETIEPWQKEFTRDALTNTLMAEMKRYFINSTQENCAIEVSMHFEKMDQDFKKIDLVAEKTKETFCNYFSLEPSLIIGNYDFAKDVVSAESYVSDNFGGICGQDDVSNISGCAHGNTAWVNGGMREKDLVGVTAHELFHLVQDSIASTIPSHSIPPGHEQYVPMWLVEGSAMTYQSSLIEHLGLWEYSEFYKEWGPLNPRLDVSISLKDLEIGWEEEVYSVGHLATDYLIANVGMDSFLNIWEELNTGKTFKNAFASAIGISLEEFYLAVSLIDLK